VRTQRSAALLGVLAAGVLLTQQACSSTTEPGGEPVAFTPPASNSSSAAPAGTSSTGDKTPATSKAATGKPAANKNPILAGKRQIVIKPVPTFESIVVVDAKGRLSLTDGEAEHGLFVLTPVGDKYQIKTAKPGAGGEPSCMGIKKNGSASLTVVAAACDTSRDGQLFTITRKTKKPTYAISNGSAFLQEFPSGLIAEELGDAPLKTTFEFVDNGPSKLPSLD
jgi:hypothetical protein